MGAGEDEDEDEDEDAGGGGGGGCACVCAVALEASVGAMAGRIGLERPYDWLAHCATDLKNQKGE